MHNPFRLLFPRFTIPKALLKSGGMAVVILTIISLFPDISSSQPMVPGGDTPYNIEDAVHEIVKDASDQSSLSGAKKQTVSPSTLTMEQTCARIGAKLGSVDKKTCLSHQLSLSGGVSVEGIPLLMKEYPPVAGREPQARILVLGGIHGDEYSSVSIVFKWMDILAKYHSGLFHWHVVPLVNPDGLLRGSSRRTNARGVDLNRNFPTSETTEEWLEASRTYWINETHKDPRRYPGPLPLSEPESRWVAEEIARFKPDAVISVHAPYGLLDFDGPPNTPPERLGSLFLSLLGTYPGSMGRFCGENVKIPIITIELKYAGIMPPESEIRTIWMELVQWLRGHVTQRRISSSDAHSRGNNP